jgi:TM2 domain-containing membrane protein YozV
MADSAHMEQAEARLRDQIHALPQETKQAYYTQIRQRTRDPDTYAALNWGLIAGLHHFYLGNWPRGVLDLTALIVGLLLIFWAESLWAGVGIIVLLSLFELWELFNSQMIVRRHNLQQGRQLLRELGANLAQAPTIDPTR